MGGKQVYIRANSTRIPIGFRSGERSAPRNRKNQAGMLTEESFEEFWSEAISEVTARDFIDDLVDKICTKVSIANGAIQYEVKRDHRTFLGGQFVHGGDMRLDCIYSEGKVIGKIQLDGAVFKYVNETLGFVEVGLIAGPFFRIKDPGVEVEEIYHVEGLGRLLMPEKRKP
jgi:hypothetical protein